LTAVLYPFLRFLMLVHVPPIQCSINPSTIASTHCAESVHFRVISI
jgi:hypothetical protein